MKAVAVALGINRQEMAQFAEPIIDDPPPLFPVRPLASMFVDKLLVEIRTIAVAIATDE